MKRPRVEIVRLSVPFDKQKAYRARGYKLAPHDRGAHARFGLIASKPAKAKKRGRR